MTSPGQGLCLNRFLHLTPVANSSFSRSVTPFTIRPKYSERLRARFGMSALLPSLFRKCRKSVIQALPISKYPPPTYPDFDPQDPGASLNTKFWSSQIRNREILVKSCQEQERNMADCHVRIWETLGLKFPLATRLKLASFKIKKLQNEDQIEAFPYSSRGSAIGKIVTPLWIPK